MKRAAALVILVFGAFFAVVLSTFYGVNSAPGTGHAESKTPVKLTFMNSWGGFDTKAGVLEELFESFEKANPGVEVENQSISNDDFLPSLKEKFATGSQPDVFGLWPGSDIRSLIKAGEVADLTDVLNDDDVWRSSFDPSLWPQVMQNGKIYGIPVEITFEGLFVNKKLFKDYNVEIPEDYGGLLRAIDAFKANNIIPIAFNCKPEGSYLYQNIAMSLAGKALETPFQGGEINKSYIDAMYIMRHLFEIGAFPPSNQCFSMESTARDDLFLRQKAAMIVQGSWFIDKCNSDDVSFVPFPHMSPDSKKDVVYGLGCGTFYISRKAFEDPEKRNEAIGLIKYLTSRSSCAKLAKQTDMISNIDLSSYSITYNSLTQSGLGFIKSASALVGPPDSYITRSVWENVIVQNFPDMLSNKLSPEALWDRAIKAGAEEK